MRKFLLLLWSLFYKGRKMKLGRLHRSSWWLLLCVPLAGLRDDQGAGKTFLGVSGRLFTEEVTVVSRRSEAHGPLQCGWASPNPLRTRRWRTGLGSLSLLSWKTHLLPSDSRTSLLLVLGPSDSEPYTVGSSGSLAFGFVLERTILPASLGLQPAEGRSWDYSSSVITWASPS